MQESDYVIEAPASKCGMSREGASKKGRLKLRSKAKLLFVAEFWSKPHYLSLSTLQHDCSDDLLRMSFKFTLTGFTFTAIPEPMFNGITGDCNM